MEPKIRPNPDQPKHALNNRMEAQGNTVQLLD